MKQLVFIIHSSKDRDHARQIHAILERLDINCWDISPGNPGETQRALADCSKVLLLVSSSSYDSREVAKQMQLAEHHKKEIVPVRLESVAAPKLAAYRDTVDYFGSGKEGRIRKIFTPSRWTRLKKFFSLKEKPPLERVFIVLGIPAAIATVYSIKPIEERLFPAANLRLTCAFYESFIWKDAKADEAVQNQLNDAIEKGNWEKAKEVLKKLVDDHYAIPGVRGNLAASYLELGDTERAEKNVKSELTLLSCLEPKSDEQLKTRQSMGDPSQIRAVLKRVRALALYNLACIYAEKGEQARAFDSLRETIGKGFVRNSEDLKLLERDRHLSTLHGIPDWNVMLAPLRMNFGQ